MKSKNGLLILFLLLIGITITAFLAMQNIPTADEQRAGRIIDAYIVEKGVQALPGTKAYSQFMKGILLGDHPELTNASLGYLENPGDEDLILNVAAAYIARQAGRPEYGEISEAPMP